jgi:hypothetical protein
MTMERSPEHHPVDRPDYYVGANGLQWVDVEEAWGLGSHLAQALQYIVRAERKGELAQDLGKAAWWLKRAIAVNKHHGPLPLFCSPLEWVLPPKRVEAAFNLNDHAIGALRAIYHARTDASFHLPQALGWVERWMAIEEAA